ncbi:Esterase-like protein [Paramyrothecium foliicola]|nr:Esterase-like protein [Paramyrothecium foliicola]
MKRCTVVAGRSTPAGFTLQPRRWASYNKNDLTEEALTRKIEAGFGDDDFGKTLQIDTDTKTISTASGSLPISPIFDPQWMKARRRQTKSWPSQPTGRFRQKLANNPYARALATPIRQCPVTRTLMPRYFLQDFETVQHPETGKAWLAPGPLAFASINGPDTVIEKPSEAVNSQVDQGAAREVPETQEGERKPHRSAVTSYALSQKWVIDSMVAGKRPSGGVLSVRSGMAVSSGKPAAVLRQDMGDLLLNMMRRTAVDALIRRSTRDETTKHLFLEPVSNWDDIKNVKLRGCVLWLPRTDTAATQYATFDVDGFVELIQPEDYSRPSFFSSTSVPAFLIHDGGGTVFAYHCLGQLKRSTYGIRNPNFHSGDVFPGGLREMGRLYTAWIRETIAQPDFLGMKQDDGSVDIILGGWSLGGLLSLEVLNELEDDLVIRVVGILMIDSVYPFDADLGQALGSADPSIAVDALGALEKALEYIGARERNQVLCRRAMTEALKMLQTWKIPPCSSSRDPLRPKVIQLRATQYVPKEGPEISTVDTYREEKTLGWDRYDKAMFDQVIDVEGHHFDMFDTERIDATTAIVKEALNRLARLSHHT